MPLRNHRGPWSSQEDRTLRRLFGTIRTRVIAERMGRTVVGVQNRIRRLGLSTQVAIPWKKADEDYLRSQYPMHPVEQIAKKLNRTLTSVKTRVVKLGIRKPSFTWSRTKLSYLQKNYGKETVQDLATKFHCSPSTIQKQARLLGVTKRVYRKPWSGRDDSYLRRNIFTMKHREIAAKLDRTEWAISQRAFRMGLLKKKS